MVSMDLTGQRARFCVVWLYHCDVRMSPAEDSMANKSSPHSLKLYTIYKTITTFLGNYSSATLQRNPRHATHSNPHDWDQNITLDFHSLHHWVCSVYHPQGSLPFICQHLPNLWPPPTDDGSGHMGQHHLQVPSKSHTIFTAQSLDLNPWTPSPQHCGSTIDKIT